MKFSIRGRFVQAIAETVEESTVLLSLKQPRAPRKMKMKVPCGVCGRRFKSLKMHSNLTGHVS